MTLPKSWSRRFPTLIGAAILMMAGTLSAAPAKKPFTRGEATRVIADARKIGNPSGIERLEKIRIGGIDQWVSIRGRDRRNPVILVIHGGPGYPLMPMSWWISRDWEEYFTVVQWDQRGAGKTYMLNDPAKVAPTLSLKRNYADAEEMAQWVRRELGKKKIFILGHSAGTYAGLEMAMRHPDWIHAYVGVGQIADMPESERRGWTFAMNAAHRAHNKEAITQLKAIVPYFAPGHPSPLKDVFIQRKWINVFGGTMAYRTDNEADSNLARLSPDYTDAELPKLWAGNKFTESALLLPIVSADMSVVKKLDCPLIVMAGRHDYVANSDVAAQWVADIKAPFKQLVWFEDSGHMPMTEEPAKFLVSLLRYARPLAERAGDGAPSGISAS